MPRDAVELDDSASNKRKRDSDSDDDEEEIRHRILEESEDEPAARQEDEPVAQQDEPMTMTKKRTMRKKRATC